MKDSGKTLVKPRNFWDHPRYIPPSACLRLAFGNQGLLAFGKEGAAFGEKGTYIWLMPLALKLHVPLRGPMDPIGEFYANTRLRRYRETTAHRPHDGVRHDAGRDCPFLGYRNG